MVQRGDTLWSISSRYLHNPWEWKELWHVNPKIKNPNRLYPGAVLVLDYYENKPSLKVLSNGTVKLSPNARPLPWDEAVPAIPLSDIKAFLNESLVLDVDVLSRAPYIVAFVGELMMGGQGDDAYR
ncbi:MAG: LysM peptidoglycan-binding domain-containing protein [Legionella sp.]